MKTRLLLCAALFSTALQAAEMPQPFDFNNLTGRKAKEQKQTLYEFLSELPEGIRPTQPFYPNTILRCLKEFTLTANTIIMQQNQPQNPILLAAPNILDNNQQQNAQVENLRNQLENAQKVLADRNAEVEQNNQHQNAQVEDLRNQLENAQKILADRNAEVEQNNQQENQQIADLKQKLNAVEKALADKNAEVEQNNQQENQQVADLKQKLDAAEKVLADRNAEVERNNQKENQQVADLKQKLDAAEKALDEKDAEVEQNNQKENQQVADLKQKLDAAEKALAERNAEVEQNNQQENQQIADLKQKLDAAEKALDEKDAEVEQNNQQKDQQIADLNQKLNAAEKALDERNAEIVQGNQQNEKIETLEKEIETQNQALLEKDVLLQEKEAALQAMQKKMEELEQKLNAPRDIPAPININNSNSNEGIPPAPPSPARQLLAKPSQAKLPRASNPKKSQNNIPSINPEDLQNGVNRLKKPKLQVQKNNQAPFQPESQDLRQKLESLNSVEPQDNAPQEYLSINPLANAIKKHQRSSSLNSGDMDLLSEINNEIKNGNFAPKFSLTNRAPKLQEENTGNTLFDALNENIIKQRDAHGSSDSEEDSDDSWSDDEEKNNILSEDLDNHQETEEDSTKKNLRKIRNIYRQALQIDTDRKWTPNNWLLWEYNNYRTPEQQEKVDERIGTYIDENKEELTNQYNNIDFSNVKENFKEGKREALLREGEEDRSFPLSIIDLSSVTR